VNLGVDSLVGGVVHEDSFERHFVKDGEHSGRGVGEKVCEDRFG
jgi:hypothetical protein